MIIAFSPVPTFDVRLPAGNDLHLVIHIRDLLDSITEYDNISSVTVLPNLISNFKSMKTFRESNNELIEILSSGNQNPIGQVINLISQTLDQINNQTVEKALSSIRISILHQIIMIICCFCLDGIPLTTISISSLGSPTLEQVIDIIHISFISFSSLIDFNTIE